MHAYISQKDIFYGIGVPEGFDRKASSINPLPDDRNDGG